MKALAVRMSAYVVMASEQVAADTWGDREYEDGRQGERFLFQILPDHIAYDEHRARIVAEGEEVSSFFSGYVTALQQICRHFASHRVPTHEPGKHCIRTISGDPEETAEKGTCNTGNEGGGIRSNQQVGQDDKGKQRGKDYVEPEENPCTCTFEHRLWKHEHQTEHTYNQNFKKSTFHVC